MVLGMYDKRLGENQKGLLINSGSGKGRSAAMGGWAPLTHRFFCCLTLWSGLAWNVTCSFVYEVVSLSIVSRGQTGGRVSLNRGAEDGRISDSEVAVYRAGAATYRLPMPSATEWGRNRRSEVRHVPDKT